MFIHKLADVQSDQIGVGTKIGQFCVVMKHAKIGIDCNIYAQVLIDNDVSIGDRVTIKSGVQIWESIIIEDDVFIGSNVTFTNDLFSISMNHPDSSKQTLIENGASIGANATILAGTKIGKHAEVGAGAVVTKNVPPYGIVAGNPASINGYVDSQKAINTEQTSINGHQTGKIESAQVKGVCIYKLPLIEDTRGSLSFAEVEQFLPFNPKRYFLVYDVKSNEIRGEHAHRQLQQFLVCVKGSCSVVVDNGKNREEYKLNSPEMAILIPPMVWGIQYKYSSDAVLMVLASEKYDESEYIRNYDEFIELVKS